MQSRRIRLSEGVVGCSHGDAMPLAVEQVLDKTDDSVRQSKVRMRPTMKTSGSGEKLNAKFLAGIKLKDTRGDL